MEFEDVTPTRWGSIVIPITITTVCMAVLTLLGRTILAHYLEIPSSFQGIMVVTLPKPSASKSTGFMGWMANAVKRNVSSAVVDKIQEQISGGLEEEGVVFDVFRSGDNTSITYHIDNAFSVFAANHSLPAAAAAWLATDIQFLVTKHIAESVRAKLALNRVTASVRIR